jgi:hypothetical protein
MSISIPRLSFSLCAGLAVLIGSAFWSGGGYPLPTLPALVIVTLVMRNGPEGTSSPGLWFQLFVITIVVFWTGAAYFVSALLIRGVKRWHRSRLL